MNTKRVRIVSDGTAAGTYVLHDGKPMHGVLKVEVLPIEPGDLVMARLTLMHVELEAVAEATIEHEDANDSHPRGVGDTSRDRGGT